MDPLSIAAATAGLLSLVIQLAGLSTKYGSDSPRKAQIYNLIFELNTLKDVLQRLQEFLESEDTAPMFTRVSVLISTNTTCGTRLQELLSKLQKAALRTNKIKRAADNFMWPLTEKENREAIEDIQRYIQVFNFALTVEGCTLLSKSSKEVANTLQEQTLKLEEIKKLTSALPDLHIQIGMSLGQILQIRTLVQALPDLSAEISSISRDMTELKIAASNQERRHEEEERRMILSWLSPLSYEARQQQLLDRHQAGTGSWLLEHEKFQRWRTTKGSVLWCSGIPGAGKTFMACVVINALREPDNSLSTQPVAFIYADHKERLQQGLTNLLSSIIRQLAWQNAAILDVIVPKYREHTSPASPASPSPLTLAEYREILQDIPKCANRVFIVIDALDEIPDAEEEGIDCRFELLDTLAQLDCASLFCTSRPHINGSLYFTSFSEVVIEATDADLRAFLEAKLNRSRRLSGFLSKDKPLGDEIVQTITRKASGMFLLARLQIEQIMTALSIRQVRSILDKLSSRLSDMYEMTIERIQSQSDVEAALGMRAVSWVASIKRPLSVSEFIHAMSVEENDRSLPDSSLMDIHAILGASGGLLQLRPASMADDLSVDPFLKRVFQREEVVGFGHYTMQEFMDTAISPATSHCDIANTSLTYLCLSVFQTRHGSAHTVDYLYPFLAYAAPFWPAHAAAAGDGLRFDLVKELISQSGLVNNWLQFALGERFRRGHAPIPAGFAAAAVAMHGASNVLQFMLDDGLPINVKFHEGISPFGVTLLSGQLNCLELLFSRGFTNDPELNRAWVLATFEDCRVRGAMSLFEFFLGQNLETVRSSDHMTLEDGQTEPSPRVLHPPLISRVIEHGLLLMAKELLNKGWDPKLVYLTGGEGLTSRGSPKWTSLLHDSIRSHGLGILRLLIAAGADVNQTPSGAYTPLVSAILERCEDMVEELLKAGANIHPPNDPLDRPGNEPFMLALQRRASGIFAKLLHHGALAKDFRGERNTVLRAALDGKDERIIRTLIPRFFNGQLSKEEFTLGLTTLLDRGRLGSAAAILRSQCKSKDDVSSKGAEGLIGAAIRAQMPSFPAPLIEIVLGSGKRDSWIQELVQSENVSVLEELSNAGLDIDLPQPHKSHS